MKTKLVRITPDKKVDKVNYIRDVPESELEKIVHSIAEINEFKNNGNLLRIVALNKDEMYDVLDKELKNLALDSINRFGNESEFADKFYLNYNRLLLNFLSSMRTFLDHSETFVKRKFQGDDKKISEYKKLTNYFFDNSFSYRFLYKLRNYAQHCELPLQNFHLQTHLPEEGGAHGKLAIQFNPKQLLENYDEWGPILKEDLKKINRNFELLPMVDEVVKILIQLMMSIDNLNSENIAKAAKFLKSVTSEHRLENTIICIHHDIVETHEKINFGIINFPFRTIDQLNV